MIQAGTMAALIVVFLKKESDAFVLQRGFLFGGNDYEREDRNVILPVQLVSAEEIPIKSSLSYEIIQTDDEEPTGFVPTEKRAPAGFSTVSKRIHTCAFMRRLGLPIGLCFKRTRNGTSQKPKAPEKDANPGQAAYAYLERQWPVHSMLGGGVGR